MEQSIQEKQMFRKIWKRLSENNQLEFFYKTFLKPTEVFLNLRTSSSGNLNFVQHNGILKADKQNIDDSFYSKSEFTPFTSLEQHNTKLIVSNPEEEIKKNQSDIAEPIKKTHCYNLLSLLKSIPENVKFAICITLNGQNKLKLKKTISAIEQNIKEFAKNGISSDHIAVFIVIDGIQQAQKSIQSFFDELDQQNNIFYSEHDPQKGFSQVIQKLKEEEQIINLNKVIFDQDEMKDFQQRRFSIRKQKYIEIKNLLRKVEKMQATRGLKFDDLDSLSQRNFTFIAKSYMKNEFNMSDEQLLAISDSTIVLRYTSDSKKSHSIVARALNETKNYCNKYINDRRNLAVLYSYRNEIKQEEFIKERKRKPNQDKKISNPYLNLFILVKYEPEGIISSQNWFINGFCKQINPQFITILAPGLAPQKDALWKMYSYMNQDQKIGGVCGRTTLRFTPLQNQQKQWLDEMGLLSKFLFKLFDIQRIQQFENYFNHVLQKPFQLSFCFGSIHKNPGSFSSYRLSALNPNRIYFCKQIAQSHFQKQYFIKSEYSTFKTLLKIITPDFLFQLFDKVSENSFQHILYQENAYLASGRGFTKIIHNNGYSFSYLPDSQASDQPKKSLSDLMEVKKRQMNGNQFAFYKDENWINQTRNRFSFLQIGLLSLLDKIQYIYPALFLYILHLSTFIVQQNLLYLILQKLGASRAVQKGKGQEQIGGLLVYLVEFIYIIIFLTLPLFSIHFSISEVKFKKMIYKISALFGLFSLLVFGTLTYCVLRDLFQSSEDLVADFYPKGQVRIKLILYLRYTMGGLIAVYLLFILISGVFCRLYHIFDILISTLSVLFYLPTYFCTFKIYAICQMDNIEERLKINREQDVENKEILINQWKKLKFLHIKKFIFYNISVGFLLFLFQKTEQFKFWVVFAIIAALAMCMLFKMLIGLFYLLHYRIKKIGRTVNILTATEDKIRTQVEKLNPIYYNQSLKLFEKQLSLNQNSCQIINEQSKSSSDKSGLNELASEERRDNGSSSDGKFKTADQSDLASKTASEERQIGDQQMDKNNSSSRILYSEKVI